MKVKNAIIKYNVLFLPFIMLHIEMLCLDICDDMRLLTFISIALPTVCLIIEVGCLIYVRKNFEKLFVNEYIHSRPNESYFAGYIGIICMTILWLLAMLKLTYQYWFG